MRSKRLHSVLANSRLRVAARFTQIQQQQAIVEKKLSQAHDLLAEDGTPPQLKLLMGAHVKNSLGRARQLKLQAQNTQAAILKAAQLEAGAKRRHQRQVAAEIRDESKKQLTEIIDTHIGKPPTSQY